MDDPLIRRLTMRRWKLRESEKLASLIHERLGVAKSHKELEIFIMLQSENFIKLEYTRDQIKYLENSASESTAASYSDEYPYESYSTPYFPQYSTRDWSSSSYSVSSSESYF